MSDWEKYDSSEAFSSVGASSLDSGSGDNMWFEGVFPAEDCKPDEEVETNILFLRGIEERTGSMKSKLSLHRFAESLDSQDAPVSDQHRQELLVFIDDLFESMDDEFGTMESVFGTIKKAFPCLNRLALQLFGPIKKYKPIFAETDLARYVTDAIREGLYQHNYRDDWKDMPADTLINSWRLLLFFNRIWPQYHVGLVLMDMLEYMYTRRDIIEYCQRENSNDRPEKV